MTSKDVRCETLALYMLPYLEKSLCTCVRIKDFKMSILCYLVGPIYIIIGKAERDWYRSGKGYLTMKAEIGDPKPRTYRSHQKLKKTRNGFSCRAPRWSGALPLPWFPLSDTDFRLLALELWKNKSLLL